MERVPDWEVENAMMRFGGSFVRALGSAFQQADQDNHQRLLEAFPELWVRYARIARDSRPEVEA